MGIYMELTTAQQNELFHLIQTTIEDGFNNQKPRSQVSEDLPLNQHLASFVTLKKEGELRGCIGTLVAYRPLIEDIAHNAYNAAFRDSRFEPLTPEELNGLTVEFSILSQPKPIVRCESREDLIKQLRPNVDGLILSEGARKATFLPSVWSHIPSARDFVHHLMIKAGIKRWVPDILCERYEVTAYEKPWEKI